MEGLIFYGEYMDNKFYECEEDYEENNELELQESLRTKIIKYLRTFLNSKMI